jgi:hypothetical protein
MLMDDLLLLPFWAIGTVGALLIAAGLNGALPADSKTASFVSLSILIVFIGSTGLGCAWVIHKVWTNHEPPGGWHGSPAMHSIFISGLVSLGTVGVWGRFWQIWKKKAKRSAHDQEAGP